MHDMTILTITNDPSFLQLFRRCLHDQMAACSHMFVADTIGKACSLLKTARPRMVVLHWARNTGSYEQLDQLLWTASVQARRIPVVVIADRYRTDQATLMYRMGVSDYISRSHHFDHIGPVFSAYLPVATPEAAPVSATTEQHGKAWASPNHTAVALATGTH